jgi:superfamily II DNA or RNA helicase
MILIKKSANMLEIGPAGAAGPLLEHALTQHRRIRTPRGKYTTQVELLFVKGEGDKISTYAGFLNLVTQVLSEAGIPYTCTEPKPTPRFEPMWHNLAGVELRGGQQRMIASMTACERGQYNGFTAMGKSFLIRNFCALYPQEDCKIAIIAQQRPIVEAFQREMCELYPGEVGLCGAGGNDVRRITICTAKSMLKPGPGWIHNCHIVLYDEVHTAGGPTISEALTHYRFSRMYGFSASTECRSDNANLIVEGIFGPVREHVTMQEGWEEGYAAKVKAYFYRVPAKATNKVQQASKLRETVWRNKGRNSFIARVARHWETQFEDPQSLIMVSTLEHAIILGTHLEDYFIVYASVDRKKIDKLKDKGLLPPQFEFLNPARRKEVNRKIENGEIRKVIATTTLGTGVDMRHLDVFIRADAGSSEISNIQFRGRVARGDQGFYVDFYDFGDGFESDKGPRERAAHKRFKSCEKEGWEPELVDMA